MARGVVPTCRYDHGPLKQAIPTDRPGVDPKAPRGYYAPAHYFHSIDLNYGFMFEIWECQKCSYIELHDQPPLDKK